MAYSSIDTAMSDAVPGRLKENFCHPCSKKSVNNGADIYCEDCTEYQRKECVKVHDIYSVMSKHKWIKANEASSMLPKYDMKGLDQCQEHSRILEFFCEDDKRLCCSTCAILNHRKCDTVVEISKKANKSVDKITKLKQDVLQVNSDASLVMQRIDKSREKVKADSAKVTEQIEHMQDNVNEMSENLKRTVGKELTSFQQRTFNDFDRTRRVCTSLITDASQTLAEIEDVYEHGTSTQQFIIAQHLTDEVQKLEKETKSARESLSEVVIIFEFDKVLRLPPANNLIPGKLTTKYKVPGNLDNAENNPSSWKENIYDDRSQANSSCIAEIMSSSWKENNCDDKSQSNNSCIAEIVSSSWKENSRDNRSQSNYSCNAENVSSSETVYYNDRSHDNFSCNANNSLCSKEENTYDDRAQATYSCDAKVVYSSTEKLSDNKPQLSKKEPKRTKHMMRIRTKREMEANQEMDANPINNN